MTRSRIQSRFCHLLAGAWLVAFAFSVWSKRCEKQELSDRIPGYRFYEIEINIAETEVARLRTRPREDVMAKLTVNGLAPTSVQLRLKGNGSFQVIDKVPNFSISCRGKSECGPFSGGRFYLHNSIQDQSFLCDFFSRSIFREMGIRVGDLGFAWVRLNDREEQLYTVVQAVNERVLGGSGSEDDVELWEIERGEIIAEKGTADWVSAGARFDAENLMKIAAADYVTANEDGFSFSFNNAWAYRRSAQVDTSVMPHTTDTAFIHSDIVLRVGPTAAATRELLSKESDRLRVLDLVKTHARGGKWNRLREMLSETQCMLEDDLGRRSRPFATRQCAAAQQFLKRVDLHVKTINEAIDIEERKRRYTESFSNPSSWVLQLGAGAGIRRVQGAAISVVNDGNASSMIGLKSYFMIAPGRYTMHLGVHFANESKREVSPECRIGIGHRDWCISRLTPGYQEWEIAFEVHESRSTRLFKSEWQELSIELVGFSGLFSVDASSIRIAPR